MVQRQCRYRDKMGDGDRQDVNVIGRKLPGHESFSGHRHRQFAETQLDSDFPETPDAQQQCIIGFKKGFSLGTERLSGN